MDLKIVRLKGPDIRPYIVDLAKLRIEIFKEYPFLYDGNLEYETHYLQTYLECSESIMVLVFDKNQIVGISTATPLQFAHDEMKKPFLDLNKNIADIFYIGESVLHKDYRGQGIYRSLFNEREIAAKDYGCHTFTFCTVSRPEDHPEKPPNYIPLNKVWERFGYKKHPEICTAFEWKEINEDIPSFKPMVFWLKQIPCE